MNEANKFNGEGFFTWQTKCMYTLMRKDLWDLIDGEGEEISMGSQSDKRTRNNKALGIIAQNLGNDVIHHIVGIKDVKLAWEQLNKVFGTESKSTKMHLLMQFFKLDKKEGISMTQHINTFKALKQQLHTVNKRLEDDEAIAVLLSSVDKNPYDGLVTTLMNNKDMNLHEVESSLLDYEQKLKEKNVISQPTATAFYTRGGRTSSRGRGTLSTSRTLCTYCNKPGHEAKDCWNKGKPKCNKCSKFGHDEANCWSANFVSTTMESNNDGKLF